MPPRFKSGLVLACMLLALYVVFWRNESPFESVEHPVDVLKNDFGDPQAPLDTVGYVEDATPPAPTNAGPADPIHKLPTWGQEESTSAKAPAATKEPIKQPTKEPSVSLQDQYTKEYEALGQKENARQIYGQTLRHLIDTGAHEGFASSQLSPSESGRWTEYSQAPPMKYNPYPDYNAKAWKTNNQGEYVACDGPDGPIEDLLVWSGHPAPFSEPSMGSWITINLDSNLCFERENRLGAYGLVEDSGDSRYSGEESSNPALRKRTKYNDVNWGNLQKDCVDANSGRFAKRMIQPQAKLPQTATNSTSHFNGTGSGGMRKRMDMADPTEKTKSKEETDSQEVVETIAKAKAAATNTSAGVDPETGKKLHGLPEHKIMPQMRTAILLRAYTGQAYTDNDKQNIRSLISELCLRSGGEYQVFLLVQVKDDSIPIYEDISAYQKVIRENIPEEFRNMVVLWNDAEMKKLYPRIPEEVNNVHQSQWLSVQKFAVDHPEFDFYWNWEMDVRYTGHHYNLLEKLHMWTMMQPRKNLWERNERFYIPKFHYTYAKFKEDLRRLVGSNSIWGAVSVPGLDLDPIGPDPPVSNPKDDDWRWGTREDADYISLAPMFNPVNTTWPGRNDVWGYAGEDTPRRASIGTHSRCSKKLLERMHIENLRGNHVSSEMTPQTVSLLHGLKAVFAPIPIFFDRAWPGESLQKYFNPGPNGVSGSTEDSPFSWKQEKRFQGATWYYRATPPMRLWNNWLGWEDTEIGGAEWEKTHGRTCLPPLLLHPIKGVQQPPPGHTSISELPYE